MQASTSPPARSIAIILPVYELTDPLPYCNSFFDALRRPFNQTDSPSNPPNPTINFNVNFYLISTLGIQTIPQTSVNALPQPNPYLYPPPFFPNFSSIKYFNLKTKNAPAPDSRIFPGAHIILGNYHIDPFNTPGCASGATGTGVVTC